MSTNKYKNVFYRLSGIAALASALIMSCTTSSFAREDDNLLAVKEDCAASRYNVLVLEHNPPFSWVQQVDISGTTKAHGIGVYILEELLSEANIPKKYIVMKATETRDDLEFQTWRKPVDTAVGIQYYPGLSSDIQDNFLHPAYMSNPIVAVFAKGKDKKYKKPSDLANMTGAYIKSDHIDFLFSKEMYLSSVDSVKEAFETLLTGKVDYILMGFYTATMEAAKYKITDKLTITEKPLRRVENFLTLNQNRICKVFTDDFNARIKEISKDKVKMGNLLYRAYQEYEEQTKSYPALNIPEPTDVDKDDEF